MAEFAVAFVLEKLTTLLEEQVKLIKDVKQEVEYVRDELERITAFLRVADSAQHSDPELKIWVNQVRDLAYKTEDVIDQFMLHRRTYAACCLFSNLKTDYRIASDIQRIKSRMTDIAAGHRRYRYKFTVPNQDSAACSSHGNIDRRSDALLLEEGELVGIHERKRHLVTWLLEGSPRLKVAAVVGMGGLGKTTLVKKVFDDPDVKKHFHNHAWITVSQSFKAEELFRDTIQQLFDEVKLPLPPLEMNGNRLKAAIKDFLRRRRFLLVFDDVWSIQAWEAIKYVLPNEDQGSRVVVTTRLMNVASSSCVESGGFVYELNPLSEEESRVLFCRKVFQGNSCPRHLSDICRGILRKCGGLPLAIVAVGGVLSTKKETNVDEWKLLSSGLGSELEGNEQLESMSNILLLSFNYLPYYLKPCFMYLSSYPEDHLIEHNALVRLWIAEGFVRQKEGQSLEEVAQGYLNELITRSLLRPVRLNDDGSVKVSCIHDFYREIILTQSRDQNFVTTNSERYLVWHKRVRRLSVHRALDSSDVERYGSRLCSLLVFGVGDDRHSLSSILQLIKNSRMLKVLDLSGLPLKYFPEVILELFHLKCLCLRDTLIKRLPRSINKLKKLEILDLKETYITELPVGILQLQHLRQLLVYRHVLGSHMPYNYVRGFKALRGIGCLKSLQKLCSIEVYPGSQVLKEIAAMTELKRLSIIMFRNEDCMALSSTIENLGKLSSLCLRALEGETMDLHYLSSPPPFLQRLYLGGKLKMFPRWIQSLRNLVKIYVRWSRLMDDPLEYLQDLPNLVHIEFLDAYIGQKLCFKAGKFHKLELLGLDKLEFLKRVIFEEGAAPRLHKLIIQRCVMMESIPVGMERLTNLKILEFFDMPDEFILPLSPEKFGDEYWKVAHIPEVYHTYWRNGSWEVYPLGQAKVIDESGFGGAAIVKTQEHRNWL